MTTLPTAAALAVLVLMAGVAGVVAADTTASMTATATAAENATDVEPTTLPPVSDEEYEAWLIDRLSRFDLTDEQVETIVDEAVHLRDDGASRLVIKSSIVMHLYEFGVDAPFLQAGIDGDAPTADRIASQLGERFDLTEAQVDEIASTIARLDADGASRTEIQRAVHALLVDYGVDEDELAEFRAGVVHAKAHRLHERADALHAKADRLHHASGQDRPTGAVDRQFNGDSAERPLDRLEERYDLTDEQVETLDRLVRGMLDDGATRDEVRDAVRDQLSDWGYDVQPVDAPAGDRGPP